MFWKKAFLYSAVCVLLAGCQSAGSSSASTKRITKAVRQQAEILEELGFTGITEELITDMVDFLELMESDFGRDIYPGDGDLGGISITTSILSWLGRGIYDYDTFTWSPTSEMVYSFDTEIYDISRMYTNFLKGVASINCGDFVISDVEEDTTQINWDTGTGVHVVRFLYNENAYEFVGRAQNDWIDLSVIKFMNEVLEKEGNPKRYFVMSDGMQERILLYNTKEWVQEFSSKLGCLVYEGTE